MNAAVTALNFTAVAPVNALPVIVTLVPTGPLVGVKLSIFGLTLKLVALVPVPPGAVTVIFPVVAPLGTEVEIELWLPTLKVAAVPLNFTAVAPVKPDPATVTAVATVPEVGREAGHHGRRRKRRGGSEHRQPDSHENNQTPHAHHSPRRPSLEGVRRIALWRATRLRDSRQARGGVPESHWSLELRRQTHSRVPRALKNWYRNFVPT